MALQVVIDPRAPRAPDEPPMRVVVADDNPISAELLRTYMESLGYSVDWAADGAHALALAASGSYQLMLLDVNMPVYDGVEVMRRLHMLTTRHLRVIAVTADRLATRREEMVRMGVEGYLTKPVSFTQLRAELARVLQMPGR